MERFQVMQEQDTGEELNTWYVYDHENNDVAQNEWFDSEKEAQDFCDYLTEGAQL
jgi:hypothetical protein